MKKIYFLLVILPVIFQSHAQDADLQTWFEKSGELETPRYDETVAYCRKLAERFPVIHYLSFGTSPQGRDLPLLIVDKEGLTEPAKIHASGKVVLMVQACIHAGEPDGKDAGMMLLRDIVTGKYPGLLDHVTILFIPILNVDGHERFGPYNRINQNGPEEMGWRVTAQGLNLNRDFIKAEAPEMKAWLKLFNAWMPEFLVDCHVTDGADYQYIATYGLELYGNMEPSLTAWSKDTYLAAIKKDMAALGIPISPYVMFRKWNDPRSGLYTNPSPPMLAQGYTALRNRPGLLIETHMLKDYRTRVNATYEILKSTLGLLNKEYHELIRLVREADDYSGSREFRSKPFPVQFEVSKQDSTMIDFLGISYDAVKSDLTGDTWFKYGKEPKTYQIPFFDVVKTKASVRIPEAYIIPPEWEAVIELLDLHGIKYQRLTQPVTIRVNSYKFNNIRWKEVPYQGRHTCSFDFDEITEDRDYPKGSVVVNMNQPGAKVVAVLLEPKAVGSLLYWGFFDVIFEQKEYFEPYVMEVYARKMLAENPGLKEEFEKMKAEKPDFAKDPMAILAWFYSKSPYWDPMLNLYPVGKIADPNLLQKLLN